MPTHDRNCACAQVQTADIDPPLTEHRSPKSANESTCTCCACTEPVSPDVTQTSQNGESYCDGCYDERFTRCDGCQCELARDRVLSSENGDQEYCSGCYHEHYTSCDGCSCELSRGSDGEYVAGDCTYCRDCFYEHRTTCDRCGCSLDRDDACYCEDDDSGPYCERCFIRYASNFRPGAHVIGRTFTELRSRRRYGVELEVGSCEGYLALKERPLRFGATHFGAKPDGSQGVEKEFYSSILQGDEGLAAIRQFCAFADDWSVNRGCGLHLHLDAGDLDEDQLRAVVIGYAATCHVWQRFVAPSRLGNTYCGLQFFNDPVALLDRTWPEIKQAATCRYAWLNLCALDDHGTLEIRLHQGTLNPDKVCNWVKAHSRFVDWCAFRDPESVVDSFYGPSAQFARGFHALANVWADDELTQFYASRGVRFGATNPLATARVA